MSKVEIHFNLNSNWRTPDEFDRYFVTTDIKRHSIEFKVKKDSCSLIVLRSLKKAVEDLIKMKEEDIDGQNIYNLEKQIQEMNEELERRKKEKVYDERKNFAW